MSCDNAPTPEKILPQISRYPDLREQMAYRLVDMRCGDLPRITKLYREKLSERLRRDKAFGRM